MATLSFFLWGLCFPIFHTIDFWLRFSFFVVFGLFIVVPLSYQKPLVTIHCSQAESYFRRKCGIRNVCQWQRFYSARSLSARSPTEECMGTNVMADGSLSPKHTYWALVSWVISAGDIDNMLASHRAQTVNEMNRLSVGDVQLCESLCTTILLIHNYFSLVAHSTIVSNVRRTSLRASNVIHNFIFFVRVTMFPK